MPALCNPRPWRASAPPLTRYLRAMIAGAAIAASFAVRPAQAYIGPSFLQVPGVSGGWAGAPYRDWVRLEAHYWSAKPRTAPPLFQGQKRTRFSAPIAPRSGPGILNVSLLKQSPAYGAHPAGARHAGRNMGQGRDANLETDR
jgi:hypothetical protein